MRRAGAVALVLVISLGLMYCFLRLWDKGPQANATLAARSPSVSSLDSLLSREDGSFAQRELTIRALHADVRVPPERRVTSHAELTLELNNPADGKLKIESVAKSCGGFVVSSEVTDSNESAGSAYVTMVLRVPAAAFNSALDQVRRLGYVVRKEKITRQDVTEEYVDLEARLKAKKTLEAQLLGIMKRAGGVSEALEVQKALGDVRAEIEQMEARRRLLENEVNMSSVTLYLQWPAPTMSNNTPTLLQRLVRAFSDGLDDALQFVFWFIRFVLVLIPFVIFVVLPIVYAWRRVRRSRQAPAPLERASADVSGRS